MLGFVRLLLLHCGTIRDLFGSLPYVHLGRAAIRYIRSTSVRSREREKRSSRNNEGENTNNKFGTIHWFSSFTKSMRLGKPVTFADKTTKKVIIWSHTLVGIWEAVRIQETLYIC